MSTSSHEREPQEIDLEGKLDALGESITARMTELHEAQAENAQLRAHVSLQEAEIARLKALVGGSGK